MNHDYCKSFNKQKFKLNWWISGEILLSVSANRANIEIDCESCVNIIRREIQSFLPPLRFPKSLNRIIEIIYDSVWWILWTGLGAGNVFNWNEFASSFVLEPIEITLYWNSFANNMNYYYYYFRRSAAYRCKLYYGQWIDLTLK